MSATDAGAGRPARSAAWEWIRIAATLLTLVAAVVWLLIEMEARRPAETRAAELSYLPKGKYLRVAVLGYDQMVADLLWLKAIQHFSGRRQTTENYVWAYHAVDVVTDLDPQFVFAYQAAGTILSVYANRVDESIAILEKGFRNNPDVWLLPFILGYNHFYERCDPDSAARYLRAAAALPGSPPYLPKLAARMTMETGDARTALEFLARLYQQTTDEGLRASIKGRMLEVLAERDIRELEAAVRRYRARYGERPASLRDLVARRIISGIPEEPLGGRYVLDAARGTVTSTGLVERLRVHVKINPQIPCHMKRWVR